MIIVRKFLISDALSLEHTHTRLNIAYDIRYKVSDDKLWTAALLTIDGTQHTIVGKRYMFNIVCESNSYGMVCARFTRSKAYDIHTMQTRKKE